MWTHLAMTDISSRNRSPYVRYAHILTMPLLYNISLRHSLFVYVMRISETIHWVIETILHQAMRVDIYLCNGKILHLAIMATLRRAMEATLPTTWDNGGNGLFYKINSSN